MDLNMHYNGAPSQPQIFAANAGAATWWTLDLLYQHGPSWQMLPPILIGLSSFVGALRGYANDCQARRHKDELHRIEIEKQKGKP